MGKFSLINKYAEFKTLGEIENVPRKTRGIYALLNKRNTRKNGIRYDVVYIGMSRKGKGIKKRLEGHLRSKRKEGKWTHFSIFEANTYTKSRQIKELEGLLRVIYRKDRHANNLNVQKKYKKFKKINNLTKW